jgi:hypothetical protein
MAKKVKRTTFSDAKKPAVVWHVADGKCRKPGCDIEPRVCIQRCGGQ